MKKQFKPTQQEADMPGSERISKQVFYARGGFSNPRCWRRMKGGTWQYYYRQD